MDIGILNNYYYILWTIRWPRMWLYCRGGLFDNIIIISLIFVTSPDNLLKKLLSIQAGNVSEKWLTLRGGLILCPINKCRFLLIMQLAPLLHWIPIINYYTAGCYWSISKINVHVVSPSTVTVLLMNAPTYYVPSA